MSERNKPSLSPAFPSALRFPTLETLATHAACGKALARIRQIAAIALVAGLG